MKKRLILATTCTMLAVLLGGCAVVTNVRRQDGGSEKRMFSILGVPLWMSEKPIQDCSKCGKCEGCEKNR